MENKPKKNIKSKKGGEEIITKHDVKNIKKEIDTTDNKIIKKKREKKDVVKKDVIEKDVIEKDVVKKEVIVKDNDELIIKFDTNIEENLLHTGFIHTVLTIAVLLHPRQMDNNIEINLKQNLKKYEKSIYKTIGYIDTIHKIIETKANCIDMENSECSQRFDLTFSCTLYNPIVYREIIAKMDKITEKISTAVNGPMKIIITPNRINDKIFYTGTSDMIIRIKSNSDILTQNAYVKVYIEAKSSVDKDSEIILIGYLINIATPLEIEKYYNVTKHNINDDDF